MVWEYDSIGVLQYGSITVWEYYSMGLLQYEIYSMRAWWYASMTVWDYDGVRARMRVDCVSALTR